MLEIVAIDVVVLLRSEAGNGGDAVVFFSVVFRESHENGLVSFLVGGAGAGKDACFSFAGGVGGGGGNLTGDIFPDRPVRPEPEDSLGGSLGNGLCGLSPSMHY